MEPMNYANLGGGAAAEMFDRELEKVLANIRDLNHPSADKREITLKVEFKPDESREKARVDISVSSKMPGFRSFESFAYLGSDQRDRNKPRAFERGNPNQHRMPFMGQEAEPQPVNTIPFNPDERKSTHA